MDRFKTYLQEHRDELDIESPREPAWQSIRQQISSERKKNVFVMYAKWWAAVCILLLAGSGILYFYTGNQASQTKIKPISAKDTSSPGHTVPNEELATLVSPSKATLPNDRQENKPDSSFEKSKLAPQDNHQSNDLSGLSQERRKKFRGSLTVTIRSENKKDLLKVDKGFTPKTKENYSEQTNKPNSDIALSNINNLNQNEAHSTRSENRINIESSQDTTQHKIVKNTFLIHLKTGENTETLLEKRDSVKKIIQNPEKNRWNLGITIAGGASLIGGGSFQRNYPPGNAGSGVPPGSAPSYGPSPIKNLTGLIAGAFLEKNISPKSKISFGISYKYLSLLNKVGKRITLIPPSPYLNPSYTYYSAAGTSHSYTNNFHFLEVPFSVTIQLNSNKKLPLSWNAGMNISQLISSNALQFQSNPGVYYNDNSFFHKTQWGFSSGLSVTLFSRQKTSFSFGPYFYYSASNLAGKGLYATKHFSFIGLRTEILFIKK